MSDILKIIPLGGLGEIGKNMTLIEYGEQILIIDSGIMFPESDMLGINVIIPDFNYLMDKLDWVQAVLLTHAHEDHVGALYNLMEHVDAPVYATKLTAGMVENRMGRHGSGKRPELIVFEAGDVLQIGIFQVEPYHVTHSIPDCVGFGITTPAGLIVHSGDYKFDLTPVDQWPPDFDKLNEFGERGVLCLLADSTNATREGRTLSETVIDKAFEQLFVQAKGRIIIATFASLISRIQQVADAAIRHGRYMAITGRSMRENVKIARRLGYLTIPEELIVDIEQAAHMPAHQIVIMATGAQGEPSAVMSRLARGRHNRLQIQEGDTVVFSAHAIPGNEEMVSRMINQIFRRGANVLYEEVARVHVSGHASQDEMKELIEMVKPQYLIPVHGELRHLKAHAAFAASIGFPEENIAVVENGTPVQFEDGELTILPRMKGGYVFIDGSGEMERGWPVIRQREKLAQAGFFVAMVRTMKGKVLGKPELVMQGVVENQDADDLLEGVQEVIEQTIDLHGDSKDSLRKRLEQSISQHIRQETGKRPFVKAVVIKSP